MLTESALLNNKKKLYFIDSFYMNFISVTIQGESGRSASLYFLHPRTSESIH